MHESPDDLARLQALLDSSYESAGSHLKDIITPDRRLTAEQLTDRLDGMCLLVLATVTADGRPINGPVDGFFYRGSWTIGSSLDSIRFRHIAKRPAVSATYLPEEAVSVTTHGRAEMIDVATYDDGAYRQMLLEYYGGRFGGDASGFIDGGELAYARIDATKMFTFYLDPATL
jgi:hypothetical protein